MKSARFICLALMTKYLLKIMDVMDLLLATRVNYKKTVTLFNQILLISSLARTAFCQACLF